MEFLHKNLLIDCQQISYNLVIPKGCIFKSTTLYFHPQSCNPKMLWVLKSSKESILNTFY